MDSINDVSPPPTSNTFQYPLPHSLTSSLPHFRSTMSRRSSVAQGAAGSAMRRDSTSSVRSGRSRKASTDSIALLDDDERVEQAAFLESIMQREDLRVALEGVFFCLLDDTETLHLRKTSVSALRKWCKQCRLLCTAEADQKQSEVDSSFLMTAVERTMGYPIIAGDVDEPLLDLTHFVSIMGHLGCLKYKISCNEPVMVTDAVYTDYLEVWMKEYRAQHDATGLQPMSEVPILTRPVDRLFYKYLIPIGNVFERESHGKVGMGVQDLVRFCQAFGIPSVTQQQIAQVGDLVREGSGKNVVVPPVAAEEADANSDLDDLEQSSGPVELLSLQGFCEFLLRLSQLVYTSSPAHRHELPSVQSRFAALLAHIATPYSNTFSRDITQECMKQDKGVPILARNALAPSRCDCAGGRKVTIEGANFCTLRTVYVRFAHLREPEKSFVLEAVDAKDKRLSIVTPSAQPEQVYVNALCDLQTHVWTIDIGRSESFSVEASNDGFDYSESEAPQVFQFLDRSPQWHIPEHVAATLHKAFSLVVSYRDKRNTRFMTLESWRKLKATYDITEGAKSDKEKDKNDDVHVFFDEFAQEQVLPPRVARDCETGLSGVRSEHCVDFKAFLRLICKCTALCRADDGTVVFDPSRPAAVLPGLMEEVLCNEEARVEIAVDDILQELKLTRDAIALIEHKAQRVLDVYLGPVLCATVTDRPGYVMSTRTNVRRRHRLLTCSTYDVNNEETIMDHCFMADTFDHLLHRLLSCSFDFAGPTDPATRQPAGRCWHVYNAENKVGALWDLPGHFSNHHWQPTPLDASNPHVTMTVYKNHDDLDYVVCFMQFLRADSPARMRKLLTQRGYTLRTCLYKKV